MSLPRSRYESSQRIDPELGLVRVCTGCGEEWPLDEEFWYAKRAAAGDVGVSRGHTFVRRKPVFHFYSKCRGCWSERNHRAKAS